MAGRIRNRRELRAAYDAAERREEDDRKGKGEEGEEEDEEEDEEEGGEDEEEEVSEEEGGEEEEEEEDEEGERKPKKKKKPVKEPKPKRTRAAKVVRQKAVWVVFNNSHAPVAKFDYPKKKEAEEHAAKLKAESKTNQSYFVQMLKEPME
jgi:hypothetical protein